MRGKSSATQAADPYRGGLELGEELREVDPEVVFLFASVHYGNSPELLEGLHDGLGNEDVIVIGNSGDGFYETGGAHDFGAGALGLDSGGQVRWSVARANGVGADPAGATRSALAQVREGLGGSDPTLAFLFSDFRSDASLVERVLEHETEFPVVGGLAADDNQMTDCWLYAGREIVEDSLVMLGADGPVAFDVSIGNSLTFVGKPGRVDAANGADIQTIDGIDAMRFVERETGKEVLRTDGGLTSLTIIDHDEPEIRRLRSIVPDFSRTEGSVGLYGGIEEGRQVQVCVAHPNEVIDEVYAIAARARANGFEPVAALVVSCAGRKWLLGELVQHEVQAIVGEFGDFPILGFPSFGEIGPLRTSQGYSRNLFHNMTYVLTLIGR